MASSKKDRQKSGKKRLSRKPGRAPKLKLSKSDRDRILPRLPRDPVIEVKNFKRRRAPKVKMPYDTRHAFSPPQHPLPKAFLRLGDVPVKKTRRGPILPDRKDILDFFVRRPWEIEHWRWWDDFVIGFLDPCIFVPAKPTRVAIPVDGPTRLCKVARNCSRAFTVSETGQGNVVNVITEAVEATFTVPPDPGSAHPVGSPLVNPFTKGGINHKHQRLYVPASFYSTFRTGTNGGHYVAVVDINPASATYLDTIDYIPCGWVPEEISFTPDEEIGVIANYMQGTATIFNAATGSILAAELNGFTGAKAAAAGGPWARSVRCANVPGVGRRAFLTLTDEEKFGVVPPPGVAIFDLDSASFSRTNFTHSAFGFIDGVAVTPDQRRILLLDGNAKLHVVKVDAGTPVLERTISLPTAAGQTYFGGLAIRPTGDLAFLATGDKDLVGGTQGDMLVQVNYMTGTTLEIPNGLARQTWGVEIHSFGSPLKPHIFVCSLSGTLTIIPC